MTLMTFSRFRRLVGLVALALPALGLLGAPAVAAQAAPDLSVTLTTGADPLVAGDDLIYSAEVLNRGESIDVRIVLSPPAYIEAEAVDGAVLEEGELTWTTTLGAASTTAFEVPAQVSEIPDGELRATALLSVYVGDSTTPVVRTASADRIEGVDDEQVVESGFPFGLLWGGIAVVAVLLVAVVVLVVVLRRRRTVAEEDAAAVAETGYRRTGSQPADGDE